MSDPGPLDSDHIWKPSNAAIAELSFSAIATIVAIVAIIWKPGYRITALAAIVVAAIAVIATIAREWFPYDRYDR